VSYITVATRTGKKVHLAHPGSASTICGFWMRVNSRAMEVSGREVNCGLCLGSRHGTAAPEAPVEEGPKSVGGWAVGDTVTAWGREGTVTDVRLSGHGEVVLNAQFGVSSSVVYRRAR
jgi:hypothetical protein